MSAPLAPSPLAGEGWGEGDKGHRLGNRKGAIDLALKTLLLITITTARMIFPGVPATAPLSPKDKPTAVTNPASKSITMDLSGSQPVDSKSTADMVVPDGLKVGSAIKLWIDFTKPKTDSAPPEGSSKKIGSPNARYLTYWGSGEKIADGQPKVVASGAAASAPTAAKEAEAKPAESIAPKVPDVSYAYWPGYDSKPIADDATTAGAYALTTNYCGNATFTLGPQQNFLPAIELVNLPETFDFAKPIALEWKSVTNAVAYLLTAYGGSGGDSVMWTSATGPNPPTEIDHWAVPKEALDKYIEKGLLLPATATTATIPAGIFKGSTSAMLTVTALGADLIQTKDGIDIHTLVRSTISVPLVTKPYITHSQPTESK